MKNLDKYLKYFSENYIGIIKFTTVTQIILFLTCILLKKSNLLLHLIPFSLIISMYIALKDYAKNDKDKNLSLLFTKVSLVIFLLSFLNNGILNTGSKFATINPSIVKTSTVLVFLVDIMIILLSLVVLMNENFNEKINTFHNTSTKTLFGIKEEEEEIKPGDAVIGYTLEDNKPVILPLKDRYLHMLIIGPTGSGKTSQSIIPMINRDMTNNDIGITVIEPKGKLLPS